MTQPSRTMGWAPPAGSMTIRRRWPMAACPPVHQASWSGPRWARTAAIHRTVSASAPRSRWKSTHPTMPHTARAPVDPVSGEAPLPGCLPLYPAGPTRPQVMRPAAAVRPGSGTQGQSAAHGLGAAGVGLQFVAQVLELAAHVVVVPGRQGDLGDPGLDAALALQLPQDDVQFPDDLAEEVDLLVQQPE